MYLTHSKLAKYLHLKIGAKVIKKTNINKLKQKIMERIIKEFQTAKELKNEFRFHYNLNKNSLYTKLITIKK